ncbi:MAG: hypothetical protein HGA70_03495 [Chlorobiaceae bacterium]|nr:hypothetical protein [Chlorobiaceae bacterium]NTW09969.1 hypothetical protein [Chlorobiaceae bacterium]
MNAENIVIPFLNRRKGQTPGGGFRENGRFFPGSRENEEAPLNPESSFRTGEYEQDPSGFERSGFRELVSNALEFDIGQLLQLKSFVYLLVATGLFLFQTNNTLSIINLSLQNEKLRTELDMINSVLTSQELKVHELHSIRNIAEDAALLGLSASSTPPVELVK